MRIQLSDNMVAKSVMNMASEPPAESHSSNPPNKGHCGGEWNVSSAGISCICFDLTYTPLAKSGVTRFTQPKE